MVPVLVSVPSPLLSSSVTAPIPSRIGMARILSLSQILARPPASPSLLSLSSAAAGSRLVSFRHRSHRADRPTGELVEVDLDAAAEAEAEVFVGGMRRLEDAIYGIMVRRSAPDWLPFIPGSSYWVPPQRGRAVGIVEMVEKLTNPMSQEESYAVTTPRGWPSLAYFVDGQLPHPVTKVSEEAPALPDDEE